MKVIIIGGVAAGMSAASKIKREKPDAQVVVYERGRETSFGACGLPYYVSGVNKDEDLLRIRKKEAFIKSGIDLHLHHEVKKVNPHTKTIEVINQITKETWEEEYDYLIVATGADAIIPPIKNVNLKNIFTLKTIHDANRIKAVLKPETKEVTIIGGGYIGMELVEAFLHLNCKVRVIEKLDRVLNNFDPEFSQEVSDYLIKMGVKLHLGEGVESFEGDTHVQAVVTDKGSYKADLVILSVGIRPNTAFMKDTGIKLMSNGAILVNKYMESSIPDIYAGGDCASVFHKVIEKDVYLPLGTNANKQGRYIGENILGKAHAFYTAIGSAMIKIGDLELGRTGISEAEAIANGFQYKSVTISSKDHAPYYPGSKDIKIKLIYETYTKKILGAQLIGFQGTALRMDVFAVAITSGMTTREVGELDLGYAPPYAMPWDVIHIACNAVK